MRPAPFALPLVRLMAPAVWLSIAWLSAASSATAAELRPDSSAAPRPSPIGRQIADFALDDFRGRTHTLAEHADSELVVVAFLGADCPLARLYAPRLEDLAAEYADRGVTFLAVDSNRQDSISKMAHYARVYGLKMPFLKDTGNVLADQFGAERVPEVYLLDRDRVIRYAGRVDDQYGLGASSGYAQTQIRRRHLAEAIEACLAGQPVTQPLTEAPGCLIGRVRPVDQSSEVTYSNQVARILQRHCVECHREGQIAPFALTDYDEVAGWADMIAEVVREQRMPPWHANAEHGEFLNDRSMPEDQRELLYAWAAAGAPQGDPSQLPEPIEYPETWQMGEPDEVYYMSSQSFTVPAEGTLEYQYFVVNPGWTEDRWIEITEALPGNRQVVHHVFVFAVPPELDLPEFDGPRENMGQFNPGSGGVELIAGAAPGTPPMQGRPGMATFVKAGTRLLFQMHYTPCGREVEDRTAVGFRFSDPSEVRHNVVMDWVVNFGFSIPPGADNHPVEASHTFKQDTLIVSFAPHMHLRGKAFRYELHQPDGTREVLLDVPRYDFNWQVIYALAEPKLALAGSTLYCLAHFDNSEENLANPDPTSPVRWGDQTWEEMMIGWFARTTDVEPWQLPPGQSRTERFVRAVNEEPPRISLLMTRGAQAALTSDAAMETFLRRLSRIVPQVDRICATVVDGDTVRVHRLAQPPVAELQIGGSEQTFPVADAALARFAAATEPSVVADLAASTEPDLARMARGMGSSLHVPVTIDGRAATVNFWSKEPGAFPLQALDILLPLAESMTSK